jgi:hypothetical protein
MAMTITSKPATPSVVRPEGASSLRYVCGIVGLWQRRDGSRDSGNRPTAATTYDRISRMKSTAASTTAMRAVSYRSPSILPPPFCRIERPRLHPGTPELWASTDSPV